MPKGWFRGLNAETRERYPALLSYASMLTPDLEEARRLTDAAIVAVMGSLRAPGTELDRELAIHEWVARAYLDAHRGEAGRSAASGHAYSDSPSRGDSAYAPPSEEAASLSPAVDSPLQAASEPDSPLASALANLTPTERVAALAWWVDGASAQDTADRLGVTTPTAIDALHHAGIALAAAAGGAVPNRDHFASGGDVVIVEVSGGGGRR